MANGEDRTAVQRNCANATKHCQNVCDIIIVHESDPFVSVIRSDCFKIC